MSTCKRGLASLLAALMLVGLLPVTALAEGLDDVPTDVLPETEAVDKSSETGLVPEDEPDEVIYNLLDKEITVGTDESRAEEPDYALFDENGDFTIPLEDNAFFPYQVQFTWDGETWETWFMDPDDTVEVGGHSFSVTSEQTDPTALTQLGVWMGDTYIPAYPQEKAFATEPGSQLFSLLPLQEYSLTLNLMGYFPEEMSAVPISAITGNEPINAGEGDMVMWAKGFGNDDYAIIGQDGTIDLTPEAEWNSEVALELIVGTADQLDISNVRYSVTIRLTGESSLLEAALSTTDGAEVNWIEQNYYDYAADDGAPSTLQIEVSEDEAWDGKGFVRLSCGNSAYENLDVAYFTGEYYTVEALQAAVEAGESSEITDIITTTGYEVDYSSTENVSSIFTTLWYRGERLVAVRPVNVQISISRDYISYWNFVDSGVFGSSSIYYDESAGLNVREYDARKGVEGTQSYHAEYYHNSTEVEDVSAYGVKAYVGKYSTPEDAEADGKTDIAAQLFSETGYEADYSGEGQIFTIFQPDGKILSQVKVLLNLYEPPAPSISYHALETEEGYYAAGYSGKSYADEQGVWVTEYAAEKEEYDVNGEYLFTATYYREGSAVSVEDIGTYLKVYPGIYSTIEEAEAAAQDIAGELFGSGYPAVYGGNGQSFTIFYVDGTIFDQFKVIMTPYVAPEPVIPPAPVPEEEDTYFRVNGASAESGEDFWHGEYSVWIMPADVDGYYYGYPDGDLNYGCQTVFLLKRDPDTYAMVPVDDDIIYPEFITGGDVKAYLEQMEGSGAVEQTSRVSPVAFESGKALAYSAASGSTKLKNYWVTFVTQQSGPKLYVNASNVDATKDEEGNLTREVYLDAEHSYRHDVFFANIGDTPLTGLSVELMDAENVQLNEYWSINEGSVSSLAAFDSVSQMDNIAKILLEPMRNEEGQTQSGAVSGTLVIKADMGTPETSDDQEVRIKLVGFVESGEITTDTVVDAVKYIPYASVLQTNVMGTSYGAEFKMLSGSLPDGLELYENGIIYGVPLEAGTFDFTVEAYFPGSDSTDTKEFTLTILENTDANVEATNEEGYQLLDRVPDMTGYSDQMFHSEGELDQFVQFYLDGEPLREGVDYLAEEGSTRITIRAQTFRNAGTGTHTIAAEFRTDLDDPSTLKSTAQNYTISGGGSSGSTSDGYSDDDDRTERPTQQPAQPQQPETTTPPTAADVFTDVSVADWFYPDVDWAYQNELMIGVGNNLYLPGGMISAATVVTVLARMDGVDQSQYTGAGDTDIEAGQWYSAAANWARDENILPEGPFIADPPIARAKVAVMLVNYLEHAGIDCTITGEPAAFADADLMSQEENTAFQVLYQFGIFKGVGEYCMDPQGSTTRAQLAALSHRLSVFIENQV